MARQERVKTRERRVRATQHGGVTPYAPLGNRVDLGVDPPPLAHLSVLVRVAVLAIRPHR